MTQPYASADCAELFIQYSPENIRLPDARYIFVILA